MYIALGATVFMISILKVLMEFLWTNKTHLLYLGSWCISPPPHTTDPLLILGGPGRLSGFTLFKILLFCTLSNWLHNAFMQSTLESLLSSIFVPELDSTFWNYSNVSMYWRKNPTIRLRHTGSLTVFFVMFPFSWYCAALFPTCFVCLVSLLTPRRLVRG